MLSESLSIVMLCLLMRLLGIILLSDTFLSTPEIINFKFLFLLNNSNPNLILPVPPVKTAIPSVL